VEEHVRAENAHKKLIVSIKRIVNLGRLPHGGFNAWQVNDREDTVAFRQKLVRLVICGVLLFGLPALDRAQTPTETEQARQLLDFCLEEPHKCSLSVHHITGGWERHLNADRLNILASTFKVIPLIAYGRAVADGRINPSQLMHRDDWTRFWVGRDGGALVNAWLRLGQPVQVEVDQMVRAMIRESDNAIPDWLLNELGARALKDVIHQFVEDYHDVPKNIAAMFITYRGNPQEPAIGDRVVGDYSGFETDGYKAEVEDWFDALHDPSFVREVRHYSCVSPPWEPPPTPCLPSGFPSESNYRILLDRYFTQSNTRTYTRMMTGLLEWTTLPPAVQEVVEPHLEWLLAPDGAPVLADRFRRFGFKGGSLSTGQGRLTILTVTTYIETLADAPGSDRGVRAAVTIHLRGAGDILPDLTIPMRSFVGALVEDPGFALELQTRLPQEAPRPDLIARVSRFPVRSGLSEDRLSIKITTLNIGTTWTQHRSSVALFLSHDNTLDSGDELICRLPIGKLAPGGEQSDVCRVSGLPFMDDQFALLIIDPEDRVAETDEANNLQWERIQRPE
jgi:Beta-lactamase enzyme family